MAAVFACRSDSWGALGCMKQFVAALICPMRAGTYMNELHLVVALITRENDYQAEQAAAAADAGRRMGVQVQVVYAENDAVNQTQQLVKFIQDEPRPQAIIVEPVGTEMVQIARAAVAAGVGWGVLNREPDYLPMLRQGKAPAFAINIDQEEIGKIQGKQLAALVAEGNVIYIEGPSNSSVAKLRSKGMLATKPARVQTKVLKGDWTEQSAQQAMKSWLALSTSRQLHVQAVICQNDAMAMGARKALTDLPEKDREQWNSVPFTGCDGMLRTGQEWVRRGALKATVVTPTDAGLAVEMVVKNLRGGAMPPQLTLLAPASFPALTELSLARSASAPHTSQ